jgi:ER-bound oxygenase mpaB/B'/Rubber oxygenase, catalytic domain
MNAPSIGFDKFDDAFLDALRREGDRPADEVVRQFIDNELDADAGGLMHALIARGAGSMSTDEASPTLKKFADDRPPLPAWVDTKMLERGQELFALFIPQLGLGLWMASLPAGYAGAHGAAVLTHTARLVSDPKRRFLETGQFIIDVMTPGGLEPGADGSRDIRHVRLMHAAARHLLTDPRDLPGAVPFDVAKFGQPINQEDLLGTLFTFSIIGLQVLERGGVRVTDDDAECYVHTWSVIGHLMGIRADLLPLNRTDAAIVFARIQRRNYTRSSAGQELTTAAIEVMQELLALRLLRGVPAAGIREYLGNEIADLLAVPKAHVTRLVFLPPRWFNQWSYKTQKDSRLARALTQQLGRRLFRGFLAYERGGEARPSFALTDALKEQLKLK